MGGEEINRKGLENNLKNHLFFFNYFLGIRRSHATWGNGNLWSCDCDYELHSLGEACDDKLGHVVFDGEERECHSRRGEMREVVELEG